MTKISMVKEIFVVGWENLSEANPKNYSHYNQYRTHHLLKVQGNRWQIRNGKTGEVITEGPLSEVVSVERNFLNLLYHQGVIHVTLRKSTTGAPARIRLGGTTLKGDALQMVKLLLKNSEPDAQSYIEEVPGVSQESVVLKATFVGGIGTGLPSQSKGHLQISNNNFAFSSKNVSWHQPFKDLLAIHIDGIGLYQSGGGWVGGGFGFEGAMKGAGMASIMNLLTTSYHIDCTLRLVFPGVDATFKVIRDPKQLTLDLAGVRNWLESRDSDSFDKPAQSTSSADQLLKFAELLEKGLLTQQEFEEQKKKLLQI